MKHQTKAALVIALLTLSACSTGLNPAENDLVNNETLLQPNDQAINNPSSRPTVSPTNSPVIRPSSTPASVLRRPTITKMGRAPRSGVVNGNNADNINLNYVGPISLNLVVAAGSFGLAQISEDSGRTWVSRNFNDGVVHCLIRRGNDLIAGRKGGIFIWDKAQQSWQILSTDITEEVSNMTFFDEQNGLALGGDLKQTVYRTSDGGATWVKTGQITSGSYAGISVTDAASKSAILNSGGDLFTYRDGVVQETDVHMGCCGTVTFRDTQNGFAFNVGAYVTSDGGKSWRSAKPLIADGSVINFDEVYAMSFASPEFGLMMTGSSYSGKIFLTKDGGLSWRDLKMNSDTVAKFNRMRVFKEENSLVALAYADYNWDRSDSAYTFYRIEIPL